MGRWEDGDILGGVSGAEVQEVGPLGQREVWIKGLEGGRGGPGINLVPRSPVISVFEHPLAPSKRLFSLFLFVFKKGRVLLHMAEIQARSQFCRMQ